MAGVHSRRAAAACLAALAVCVGAACSDDAVLPEGTVDIGERGGTVSIPGAQIVIPAGALDSEKRITLAPAVPGDLPAAAQVLTDSIVPGTLFDFGPDGLQFSEPALLTLAYDEANLPDGTDETRLRMVRIDTGYGAIPVTSRDTVANTLTAGVEHFTWFGVVLPLPVPDLGADIRVGESVSVSDAPAVTSRESVAGTAAEAVRVQDQVEVTLLDGIRVDVAESVTVDDFVAVTGDAPPPPPPSITPSIYVIDQGRGIVVVDPETFGEITTIPLALPAENLARRPGTNEIWVTEGQDGGITVIDAALNQVVSRFDVTATSPAEIAFDAGGNVAAISDQVFRGDIHLVDANTRLSLGPVEDPTNSTVRYPRLSADGTTGWFRGSETVRFDVASRAAVAQTDINEASFTASDMRLLPDESEMWHWNEEYGRIYRHDATTLALLGTIPNELANRNVAAREGDMRIDGSSGLVYVANEDLQDQIRVVDPALGFEVNRLNLPYTPGRFVIDETRGFLYIIDRGQSRVFAIDLATELNDGSASLTSPVDLIIVR